MAIQSTVVCSEAKDGGLLVSWQGNVGRQVRDMVERPCPFTGNVIFRGNWKLVCRAVYGLKVELILTGNQQWQP